MNQRSATKDAFGPIARSAVVTLPVFVLAAVLARAYTLGVDEAPVSALARMARLWTPSDGVDGSITFSTWSGIPVMGALAVAAFRYRDLRRSAIYTATAMVIWFGGLSAAALGAGLPFPLWGVVTTLPLILLAGLVPLPRGSMHSAGTWTGDFVSGVGGFLSAALLVLVAILAIPVWILLEATEAASTLATLPYSAVSVAGSGGAILMGGTATIADAGAYGDLSLQRWAGSPQVAAALAGVIAVGVGLLASASRVFMYRTTRSAPIFREVTATGVGVTAIAVMYLIVLLSAAWSSSWLIQTASVPWWTATLAALTVLGIGVIRLVLLRSRGTANHQSENPVVVVAQLSEDAVS